MLKDFFETILPLPFNRKAFNKASLITLGIAVIFYAGSVIITGTVTPTDAVGGMITAPVLAYFIHLLMIYDVGGLNEDED